ncbi:heterokaryon incompatibility protein-domain-containing protein [Rhypophila decipiens]|uniref:Heterokaryon incompatibility protein-domain-containing protein n=1 Tax=Rhypophila decipiens TaxID=261697 RepID=A0AAN6XZA7_9PEZI|nr:heterokaryon incompatibility protein-domain-containing protein [Rhypophila decipiens]
MEINFGPTLESEPTTVLLNRVTDGLCAACHKLFHNIAIICENTDKKPRSFTEIQRAGRAGCAICKILLASWNLVYTDVSCADCGTFYQLWKRNSNYYEVRLWRHGVSNGNIDTHPPLMMVVPAPSGPNPCNDEAPPSNSGSDQCFQLMNTWLQTCLTTHSNCIVPSGPWVPTRLGDVGDLASPKVILTAKMQDRSDTRYSTLSHRWGDNVVRLTTGNLDEFQRLLPIAGMSRTFNDAFVATRKLGMRYIWIDSLCILQDSEMDWQFESAQMGQVYENSLCNFSATAASDGNQYDGLFQERDPTWGSSAKFTLPNSQEGTRDV